VDASNKIRLGNGNVTVIEGQVPFTTPSDGRFKTNIRQDIKGLDFINRLKPISYNFETGKYDAFLKGKIDANGYYVSPAAYHESESIRHDGFIAQQVQQAAKESAFDFDGIIVPQTNKEAYGLSYAQFVVPLVKAVQELNKMNDEKDAKMASLQKQIDDLTHRLEKVEMLLKSGR
jgi:hypothetical protein